MTVHTFFLGLVRKHRAECDVTDALDSLDRGVVLVINNDTPPVVDFHTNLIEAETFGIGPTADSDKHNVCIKSLLLSSLRRFSFNENGAVVLLVCRDDLSIKLELEALLCKDFLEGFSVKIDVRT